jgi:hypothetical protein
MKHKIDKSWLMRDKSWFANLGFVCLILKKSQTLTGVRFYLEKVVFNEKLLNFFDLLNGSMKILNERRT